MKIILLEKLLKMHKKQEPFWEKLIRICFKSTVIGYLNHYKFDHAEINADLNYTTSGFSVRRTDKSLASTFLNTWIEFDNIAVKSAKIASFHSEEEPTQEERRGFEQLKSKLRQLEDKLQNWKANHIRLDSLFEKVKTLSNEFDAAELSTTPSARYERMHQAALRTSANLYALHHALSAQRQTTFEEFDALCPCSNVAAQANAAGPEVPEAQSDDDEPYRQRIAH